MNKGNDIIGDDLLLEFYKMGWEECFEGRKREIVTPILQRAYNLGWDDYIIGDEVTSVDGKSNEEIISEIRKRTP